MVGALGVPGEEPGRRVIALQKTLNEVASLCSLTYCRRSPHRFGDDRRWSQTVHGLRVRSPHRTRQVFPDWTGNESLPGNTGEFPYHWNQTVPAARFWRCKWLKVREVQNRPLKKGRKSAIARIRSVCERGEPRSAGASPKSKV